MKIFDCVTFFEENRQINLRFNILNNYVDYFIVCEGKYDHQGKKKKINYLDSIRNPIITEKATILSEQNKTVFKVHDKANKKNIKKNIEKLFKVNVIKINIINQKTKIKIKQGKK